MRLIKVWWHSLWRTFKTGHRMCHVDIDDPGFVNGKLRIHCCECEFNNIFPDLKKEEFIPEINNGL